MLIVDGLRRRRSAVRHAVEADGVAEVVGEAGAAGEALRLARTLAPDVVLLRLNLPHERDGVLLCRELKDLAAPSLVVLHDDGEDHGRTGLAYLFSGADGFAPHAGEIDADEDLTPSAP